MNINWFILVWRNQLQIIYYSAGIQIKCPTIISRCEYGNYKLKRAVTSKTKLTPTEIDEAAEVVEEVVDEGDPVDVPAAAVVSASDGCVGVVSSVKQRPDPMHAA